LWVVGPWCDLGGDRGRDRAAQEKRVTPRRLRDTIRAVASLEGKGGAWLASGARRAGGPRAAGVARRRALRAEWSRVPRRGEEERKGGWGADLWGRVAGGESGPDRSERGEARAMQAAAGLGRAGRDAGGAGLGRARFGPAGRGRGGGVGALAGQDLGLAGFWVLVCWAAWWVWAGF